MFCPKCGKENSDENRFCVNCGAPLTTVKEEKAPEFENTATPETEETVTEGVSPETDETQEKTSKEDTSSANHAEAEKPDGQQTTAQTISSAVAGAANSLDNNLLKLILSASGIVIAVLYIGYALFSIPSVFTGISIIFRGRFVYGVFFILSSVVLILSRVFMAAALLLFAISRDDERDNTESLLLIVVSGGILRIALQLASQLIRAVGTLLCYGRFSFSWASFGKAILFAVLAVAIEAGLTFLVGYRPFIGKSTEELMAEIKNLPNVLLEEIEILSKKYNEKAGRKQASAASGTYSGNSTNPGPDLMNEKRSYLMYLIVGIITCGIYQLYVIYTFSRDVNIICKEDGETTPGLIKLILLSLITCGIYSFVWYYKMLTRIERQEKNWGVQVQTIGGMDLGACWVVLKLVGILISVCGIGVLVSCYADYQMFKNLNDLSIEYNKRIQNAGTV